MRGASPLPAPGRVWQHRPSTGVDVTADYSIPRPSPPPKLYLREGKNNSWRGRSWNEPKDSSSISKTRTNQAGTPLPVTPVVVCPQAGGQDALPLALVPPCWGLRIPGHLHPGSGVGAGTGGGNRSRALLVLPGAPRELFKPSEAG